MHLWGNLAVFNIRTKCIFIKSLQNEIYYVLNYSSTSLVFHLARLHFLHPRKQWRLPLLF